MKNTVITLLALPFACMFASCDSWLDIEPKGEIILTTAEEYAQLFDNTTYISYTLSDVEYLDDERLVNPQNVLEAVNSPTLKAANATFDTGYDRSEYANGNSGTGTTFYQSMYQRISKICNVIVNARSDMEGDSKEIAAVVAQAKAYRAFSYFLLVNIYAKPYNAATAETDGAVAIRTDVNLEAQPEKPKSTVAEVYRQVMKDLEEAIPDLPEKAQTPYRFNKAAGYALKAKVHLFKKEWDECIAAAAEAYKLNHATYDLVTRIDVDAHVPVPAIYASGEENLFFATSSTTDYYLHPGLIEIYKKGLSDYGQAKDVHDMRLDLYKQPRSTMKDYQFTLGYQPSKLEYATNSVGLRTTEVMLMLAECYARKGDEAKVKEYMKPYLESRYANFEPSRLKLGSNVADMVKFVLQERRKELVMGCNRFMDIRRLNTEGEYQVLPSRTTPLDTEAMPNLPQRTYTLEVNSPLYVLPFSSKVIANDPRLTSNYMND